MDRLAGLLLALGRVAVVRRKPVEQKEDVLGFSFEKACGGRSYGVSTAVVFEGCLA